MSWRNAMGECHTEEEAFGEAQKEGKKRMKRVGSVDLPQEAFHELLKVS